MDVSKIILTGAGGWIGRHVSTVAAGRGFEVVPIGSRIGRSDAGCIGLAADFGSDHVYRLADSEALVGATVMIHCAGFAHSARETASEILRFEEVNHRGTVRAVELARRVGCRRFVYVSSIAFYDWAEASAMSENSPVGGTTAYARSKLAGEYACLQSGLDARIARLATVFGAGDKGNFAKLALALNRRRFVLPGDGAARKSVIPVHLLADLLVDLAMRDVVPEKILNIALPEAPTLAEICSAFSIQCGFPPARSVPVSVLKFAARCGDAIEHIRPGFPMTTSNLGKLTTNTVVDVGRMIQCWPDKTWPSFSEALGDGSHYYRELAHRGQ